MKYEKIVKAMKRETFNHVHNDKVAGQFAFLFVTTEPRLIFCCPCGCSDISSIPISEHANRSGWLWDGNREAPTLSPSIHQLKCGWHGYLKVGQWESV